MGLRRSSPRRGLSAGPPTRRRRPQRLNLLPTSRRLRPASGPGDPPRRPPIARSAAIRSCGGYRWSFAALTSRPWRPTRIARCCANISSNGETLAPPWRIPIAWPSFMRSAFASGRPASAGRRASSGRARAGQMVRLPGRPAHSSRTALRRRLSAERASAKRVEVGGAQVGATSGSRRPPPRRAPAARDRPADARPPAPAQGRRNCRWRRGRCAGIGCGRSA